MKNLLLLLLIVSVLAGCHKQAKQGSGILTVEFIADDSLALSDFIVSARQIQLNESAEFPVSGIRKIVPLDDRYLIQVMAYRTVRLMVFSKTGEFIRPVGSSGSGPEEIGELASFLFNERDNTIEILDRQKKTIHIFDTTGNYITHRKPDAWPDDFTISPRGDYIFYLPLGGRLNSRDSTLYPGIFLFDNRGQYIRHLSLATFNNQFNVYGSSAFFSDDNNTYLLTSYDDNLYHIDGDSARVMYEIDFGERTWPQEKREVDTPGMIYISFDHIMFKGDPFASQRFIIFMAAFIGDNETGIALIDLENETCRVYSKAYDDISGAELHFIGGSDNEFYSYSKSIDRGPDPEEITLIHILKVKK